MQIIEQKITDIINETITGLGFDLVSVRMRSATLEILIDKLDDSKVTVSDCQRVSRNISALLDVENVIRDKYYLEVASCGIERPLLKLEDYSKFIGREVNVKLKTLLNGKSRYHGKILKVQGHTIHLTGAEEELPIEFDMIKDASLVLTDEMFRKMLKK